MNENKDKKDNKEKKEKITNFEEPMTEDEAEMLRTSLKKSNEKRGELPHYDNSPSARAVRYVKKDPLFFGAVGLILLLLIVSSVIFAVFIAPRLGDGINRSDITIMLGDKEKDAYVVKYKEAVKDGVLYIDARKIADFASLTVSGSDKRIKFTASDSQYIRFEDGSEFATLNGYLVEMEGKATVTPDVCLVPYSFISRAFELGLKFSFDTETNIIKVGRQVYIIDDVRVPTEILFATAPFKLIETTPATPNAEYVYSYTTDVSKYMSSIVPDDPTQYLILVNKENHLGGSYVPEGLTELTCRTASGRDFELRYDAAQALSAMMTEMTAESSATNNTFVTSAYRSYAYQETLYNRYVSEYMAEGMSESEAKAEASKTSARPGESEHQSGLCVDLMTNTMSALDESFENTAAFDWLSKNAHKFGFILRYPKDKVDITGYDYEPWHYRFVGREAATEIYLAGICLEEYLGLD